MRRFRSRPGARGLSASVAFVLAWFQCFPPVSSFAFAADPALTASADTYLRRGAPNQNQGQETILRLRDAGDNRALVQFSQSSITAAVGSNQLVSATLQLTISRNGNNWGPTGRTINVHRMTKAWTELGATWNCAVDTNTGNMRPDCSGTTAWKMEPPGTLPFAGTPAATALIKNGQSGSVLFNVTADVAVFLAGTQLNQGWLLKKTSETQTGLIEFASRQTANAPRLILVLQAGDTQPPSINITAPSQGALLNDTTPAIGVAYSDAGSGVNLSTLLVRIDATDISATCAKGPSSATCVAPVIADGAHTVAAEIRDGASNLGSVSSSFTIDATPPAISNLLPADGLTVDQSRPAVSANFADPAGSGINTASARLLLDGIDVTAQVQVSATAISFTPAADLADGSHTARVDVADNAGNPSSAQTAFTIDTIVEPPIGPQSGFIHGSVVDAITGVPLPQVAITVQGVPGEVLTGAEGVFQFPVPQGGEYLLTAAKSGYLPGQRPAEVLSGHDVAVEQISLTPIDLTVTVVPPSGGIARNSIGTIEVTIPAGAMNEPLPVQATEFTAAEQLPGPLPDSSFFTYAFDLQPDGTTFTAPVTIRLANSRGFAAGTPIPVGLYNFQTGVWEHETMSRVTPDGLWLEFQVTHFSPRDCNLPAAPSIGQQAPQLPNMSPLQPPISGGGPHLCFGSTVCPDTGDLGIEHALPGIRTLGVSRTPVLKYHSETADPSVLIGASYKLDTAPQPGQIGTIVPETTSVVMQIEGRRLSASFIGAAGENRYAFLWDGRNGRDELVPTGIYPYTIELANVYPMTYGTADVFGGPPTGDTGVATGERVPLATGMNNRVVVLNQSDSAFGAGWGWEGLQRLHVQPDDSVLIADSNGTAIHFVPGPVPDVVVGGSELSTLIGHGDGTFQPFQPLTVRPGQTTVVGALAAGDVNQDGWQDVAATVLGTNQVALVFGQGHLPPTIQLLPVDSSQGQIAVEDLDGDGALDLVVTNREGSDLSVFLGNGDGTFGPATRFGVGLNPNAVLVADLNHDGFNDVVAANPGSSDVSVLLNDGGGALLPEVRVPVGDQILSMAASDLNGDQRLDLLLGANTTGMVYSYLHQPNGTFAQAQSLQLLVAFRAHVAAGDFDGDGKTDFVVTGLNTSTITRFRGLGDGTFAAYVNLPIVPVGVAPSDAAVADVNGDGALDLVLSDQQDAKVAVLTGNGDGSFQASRLLPTAGPSTSVLVTELTARAGIQAYSALPGEFSRLVRLPDGSFVRTLTDGTQTAFSAAGLHTKTTDRNGNETRYLYDVQDRLTRVEFPGGAAFSLTYDAAGHVSTITDSANRVTALLIDANGDLTHITDSGNNARQFAYTGHRMTNRTDQRGFVTDYSYDAFGRVQEARLPERPVFNPATGTVSLQREVRRVGPSETQALLNSLPNGTGTPENLAAAFLGGKPMSTLQDGQGQTTQFLTDAFGQPLKIIDPLNRVTTIVRDVNGLPTAVTRPNGNTVTMQYDGAGNLLQFRQQRDLFTAPEVTQFAYELVFNQVRLIVNSRRDPTCPTGCRTTIEHDARGNPTRIIDALNQATETAYDARGLLLALTDPLGTATPAVPDDHQTRFTYDAATGNLLTTTDPIGRTTTLTYESAGNVRTSRDAALHTTTFTYDDLNRLTEVLDAENKTTGYEYDAAGNLIRVRDANTNDTQFAYDALDLFASTTNPLTQTKQFVYDLNRNLAQVRDAKNQTSTFGYDAANQLIEKVLRDASSAIQDTVTYAYDPLGNLALVQDNDSKLRFEYDTLGRLVKAHTGEAANPAAFAQPVTTIAYTYDLVGNRSSLSCPMCLSPFYTYDALNRLIGVTANNLLVRTFEYDVLGRLTRLADGPPSAFSYDDASQLLAIQTTLSGSPLESFAYTYDLAGNRTSLTDRFGPHAYGYDPLYRLTSADHPVASGLLDESFTYDAVGNRLTSHLSPSHLHNAANRLLEDSQFTYTYDADGNRRMKTDKTTTALTTYTYDVENQLIQVDLPSGQIVRYRYDGLGRRIEKEVAGQVRRFLYDHEDLVTILNGAGCATHVVLHGPGIDQPVGFLQDTNNNCNPFSDASGDREPIRYLLTDGLGSTTTLVAESGGFIRNQTPMERVTYDTFGTPRVTSAGPDTLLDTADDLTLTASAFDHPYLFTGREWDPETGLYYYRARYYDPRTGTFLQEDPVLGQPPTPASFNRYSYVSNNPFNFRDPFGFGEIAEKTADELRSRYGKFLTEEQIQKMGTAVERAKVIGFKDAIALKFGDPETKEKTVKKILNDLEEKAAKDPEGKKLMEEFRRAVQKTETPEEATQCPIP